MSTYMTTDETPVIRALADAEINDVTGAAAAVIAGAAAAVLIGAALGFSITENLRGGHVLMGIKAGLYDASR
jgi:bifunctional ADP-heptose synthase (sugar kinase/adenylyltransferase)